LHLASNMRSQRELVGIFALGTLVAFAAPPSAAAPATELKSAYCWNEHVLGRTEWPLTKHMCRKAVRNLGDPHALWPLLQRLASGQCVKIVAMVRFRLAVDVRRPSEHLVVANLHPFLPPPCCVCLPVFFRAAA
jgi:hypothetical protein